MILDALACLARGIVHISRFPQMTSSTLRLQAEEGIISSLTASEPLSSAATENVRYSMLSYCARGNDTSYYLYVLYILNTNVDPLQIQMFDLYQVV